jgi:SAM-dependent methyltransferase
VGPDANKLARDTNFWYADRSPFSVVSASVLGFAGANSGHRVLDLGCGTGGYAARLAESGHQVVGADTNPEYVITARGLGVPGVLVGEAPALPFPHGTFDTVLLIEVLEHVSQPAALVAEAVRVTRHNVLATVPDCTHADRLSGVGLTFEHMLERDHINFFTRENVTSLLAVPGASMHVEPGDHLDVGVIGMQLGAGIAFVFRAARRLRIYRSWLSSRLFIEWTSSGGAK